MCTSGSAAPRLHMMFDLAQPTGFDVESLFFCFAIGGIGAASYRAMAATPETVMGHAERQTGRHRWHLLALAEHR